MLKVLLLFAFATYVSGRTAKEQITASNNKFALEWFKILNKEVKKQNAFVHSPLSPHTMLSLMYTGARGVTETEMAKVLSLLDRNNTIEGYKELLTTINQLATNSTKIAMANKIFVSNDLEIKQEFIDLAKEAFITKVEQIDFIENKKAVETINNWVKYETHFKIKTALHPNFYQLSPETKIVLVNAVYFKSVWNKAFKKVKLPFKPFKGKKKIVPAMTISSEYLYVDSKRLNSQIVKVPFKNVHFTMVVILPYKEKSFINVLNNLPLCLDEILRNMEMTLVNITLPTFKINMNVDMTTTLSEMGMKTAFSEKADFSGITDKKISIEKVIQSMTININVVNTAASGSSPPGMFGKSLGDVSDSIEFYAMRPFFFIIYEETTNAIMFTGSVIDLEPLR